eukprot:scaffold3591_cov159-Amphora_coffeaeformis.AAC.1
MSTEDEKVELGEASPKATTQREVKTSVKTDSDADLTIQTLEEGTASRGEDGEPPVTEEQAKEQGSKSEGNENIPEPWQVQLRALVWNVLAYLDIWVIAPHPLVNGCKAVLLIIWFFYLMSAPTVNTKDNYVNYCGEEVFDFYDRARKTLPWHIIFIYGASLGARVVAMANDRYLPGDISGSIMILVELVLAFITLKRGELDFFVNIGAGENCEGGLGRIAFVYYSIVLGLVDTLLTLFMASLSACCDPQEVQLFSHSRDGQAWFISSRKWFKGPFAIVMFGILMYIFVRAIQTFRSFYGVPILVVVIGMLMALALLVAAVAPDNYNEELMGLTPVWKTFALIGLGLAYLWIDIRGQQTTPAVLVTVTIFKGVLDFVLEFLHLP